MRKVGIGAVAIGLTGALLAVAACASESAESSYSPGPGPSADAGVGGEGGTFPDSGSADAGGAIDANAIVLVHAASFPAFRICFMGASDDPPLPSAEVMPESNVVGVDVGTALLLPPRSERLGQAFVYLESYLRPFYTASGTGPTCASLLNGNGTKSAAIPVGSVTENLARGVHALVLGGCRDATKDPTAGADACGDDWDPATGNLRLRTLTLQAYARLGARLPVQLVQLSPSLDRSAAGRALGVAFGSLDGGAAAMPSPFVEGAVPFGEAVPRPPAQLDYASTDVSSYATTGVFVTLGGPVDDAGLPLDAGDDASARDVLLVQSLADIQRRSSPRSLPSDWFAADASYVVLSVGDLDPRLPGGARDDDPRRALHLLAVPLATPDAGVSR